MGTGASVDQETTNTQSKNLQNSKITNQNQTKKDSKNEKGINFTSQISTPARRRKTLAKVEPALPDISSMDDDEAYKTVCSEIDQALTGHYTFILESQPKEKKPTLHQLENVLEEQGYKVNITHEESDFDNIGINFRIYLAPYQP